MLKLRHLFASRNAWSHLSQNKFLYKSSVEQLACKTLLQHGFSEDQVGQIISSLGSLLQVNSHQTINCTFECWKKHIRSNKGESYTNQQQFKDVFVSIEPRLLLLEESFILTRIDQLNSLDMLRGQNDLWKVFVTAPSGHFLQDWAEFLKKYYYITYKILPWLNKPHVTDTQHPMVEHPKVSEVDYNLIKTRFLFAQRVGLKQVSANPDIKNLNLNSLLLLDIKDFLCKYTHCTLEEFTALEKINASTIGQEDDKLFQDLVDLAPKTSKKSFIKKNVEENYLLSMPN